MLSFFGVFIMPVRSTKGTANDFPAGSVAASGNNNGGVALGINHDHVQDEGSRNMSSGVPIVDIADDFGGDIGSKIVSNDGATASTTDRVGVQKAVSGGTLAFVPTTTGTRSEEFVIMGVSTKLGGVANTQLQSSRSHNNGLIAGGVSKQLVASQSGTFSHPQASFDVLAKPSTEITPGFSNADIDVTSKTANVMTFVNPADGTVAVASEIFPSRAVPGELTYHFGGQGKATTDEYKAKDSYEDHTDTSS